jgi:hypothetical protein
MLCGSVHALLLGNTPVVFSAKEQIEAKHEEMMGGVRSANMNVVREDQRVINALGPCTQHMSQGIEANTAASNRRVTHHNEQCQWWCHQMQRVQTLRNRCCPGSF